MVGAVYVHIVVDDASVFLLQPNAPIVPVGDRPGTAHMRSLRQPRGSGGRTLGIAVSARTGGGETAVSEDSHLCGLVWSCNLEARIQGMEYEMSELTRLLDRHRSFADQFTQSVEGCVLEPRRHGGELPPVAQS